MPTGVKICGIRDVFTALAAVEAGATALGFVFSDSPRRISPLEANDIARALPSGVQTVAVFYRPRDEEIREVLRGFVPHVIQTEPTTARRRWITERVRLCPVFHDGSGVIARIRTFRTGHGHALPIHLDAAGRGGRGERVDRERARAAARLGPTILAGGLNPGNVGEAIASVRPAAVDVSSGVESSPGVKDPILMRRFCEAVRKVEVR